MQRCADIAQTEEVNDATNDNSMGRRDATAPRR